MPQKALKQKYDFQLLVELGIHAICLEKLGKGSSRSLQFFHGFPRQLCSASDAAILGIGDAQLSLSSQVFQVAKDFAPILLFSRSLNSRDTSGMLELGKSFRGLIKRLSENGASSGVYCDRTFTCCVTCRNWLNLISSHLTNQDPSELLSRCRMITSSDFLLWREKLAQASEPWDQLDTLLEEKDNRPQAWHTSLSLSTARAVLESFKGSILLQPYGDAISALVLDFDRSQEQKKTPPSPRQLSADFLTKLQVKLDQSVGLHGRALFKTASEFSEVLSASRLLVRLKSEPESLFQLLVQDRNAVIKDLSGRVVRRITTFPSFELVSPSSIVDQQMTNEIAHLNIALEPISNVSKKSFSEFIEYFDRVHQHVEKKELRKQFQQWLDDYPNELRDFGKDVSKKRTFAREINSRAKILGYRFKCPKENCGIAAGLSVMVSGTSTSGQFVFKHRDAEKSVSHSLSVNLPRLQLVPAK